MTMFVSVLVSIYAKNTEFEIRRCFDSLRNQTSRPSEVIVVIDGPINIDILFIFSEYESTLLFRPIFIEKNIGLGSALNVGLGYCSCDYVARIDIDDVCKPERLLIQKEFIDSNPHDSVLGGQM
jgi:amylovoran biosynthesis glycosyltransferase AmsE